MAKPGRNKPCHCGSGKKYKHCCLRAEEEAERAERARQRQQEADEQEALKAEEEQLWAEYGSLVDKRLLALFGPAPEDGYTEEQKIEAERQLRAEGKVEKYMPLISGPISVKLTLQKAPLRP